MKKVLITLVAGIVLTFGQVTKGQNVYATNIVGTTTNIIYNTPIMISSLTVLSSLATTVRFYDATNTSLRYSSTNQSITRSSYVTNNVASTVFTNSVGQLITNYYSGQRTYFVTNSVAGGFTNRYPVIASIAVAANVPVTLPVNLLCVRGLAADTTNDASVIFSYQPFTP